MRKTTSEHMEHELAPEWEQELGRKLVEIATEMYERHEREDHGGERCQENRVGIVAFLAHRIGVRDRVSAVMFLEALAGYEEGHAEHEHGEHS